MKRNQADSDIEKKLDVDSGDEADDEMGAGKPRPRQSVKHKKRLFVGEAGCDFTVAYIQKHSKFPDLSRNITATELATEEKLNKSYPNSFPKNKKFMQSKGVNLRLGVDATKLHQDFKGQRFKRIHFNYPHDRSNFEAGTLPAMLANFFKSASALQKRGDCIHVTIPKDNELFRQSFIYGLYDASVNSGYQLWTRRKFNSDRYPGYEHKITGLNASLDAAEEGREYIFVKTDLAPDALKKIQQPSLKRVYGNYKKCLLLKGTDDDSSGLEDSSDDEKEIKDIKAAVFKAAKRGDFNRVYAYLRKGGDKKIQDEDGLSLLFSVMSDGCFNDSLACILIDRGVDVKGVSNPLDRDQIASGEYDSSISFWNTSALHCAYFNGGFKSRAFKKLALHFNIDLNATFDDGFETSRFEMKIHPGGKLRSYHDSYSLENATLLHHAAAEGELETIKFLCKLGANLNAKANLVHNKNLFCGDLVANFFENPIQDKDGETVALAWRCREAIPIIRVKNVTATHFAARSGHWEIVKYLTANGAHREVKDSIGKKPAQYLADYKSENKEEEPSEEKNHPKEQHPTQDDSLSLQMLTKNFMNFSVTKTTTNSSDTSDKDQTNNKTFKFGVTSTQAQ